MCGQNLPVRTGFGSYNPDRAKAEWRAKYGPDVLRQSGTPPANPHPYPKRDQSEDRELPPYFVVPVQNPSGVEPGLYFAVHHRAKMIRVSVWFTNPATAEAAADTWGPTYGASASGPMNPEYINMVWEDEATHKDGYEYKA